GVQENLQRVPFQTWKHPLRSQCQHEAAVPFTDLRGRIGDEEKVRGQLERLLSSIRGEVRNKARYGLRIDDGRSVLKRLRQKGHQAAGEVGRNSTRPFRDQIPNSGILEALGNLPQ